MKSLLAIPKPSSESAGALDMSDVVDETILESEGLGDDAASDTLETVRELRRDLDVAISRAEIAEKKERMAHGRAVASAAAVVARQQEATEAAKQEGLAKQRESSLRSQVDDLRARLESTRERAETAEKQKQQAIRRADEAIEESESNNRTARALISDQQTLAEAAAAQAQQAHHQAKLEAANAEQARVEAGRAQEALSGWQKRAWAAEDELARTAMLLSAAAGIDTPAIQLETTGPALASPLDANKMLPSGRMNARQMKMQSSISRGTDPIIDEARKLI